MLAKSLRHSQTAATNRIMKLNGWTLTEGRIPGEHETRDPAISDIVAALEAIHERQQDPYVILTAAEIDGRCAGYCQAVACEDASYRCEIRLFGDSYHDYRHYNMMRPDEHGRIGIPESGRPGWIAGYDPDLANVVEVFTQFALKPTVLPEIPGWQWLDITEEVDAVP